MSETTAEAPAQEQPAPAAEEAAKPVETQPKAEETDWKAEARKWEARAKENSEKAKGFDELKASQMTEQEKAVSAARDEGRAEASTEFGKQLAREAFDNLAGRRNAEFDTSKALELIDLGRFVKDGQLDRDALKEAVESIVPEKTDEKVPSFGGGARKQADRPDPGPGLPRLRDAYAQSSK